MQVCTRVCWVLDLFPHLGHHHFLTLEQLLAAGSHLLILQPPIDNFQHQVLHIMHEFYTLGNFHTHIILIMYTLIHTKHCPQAPLSLHTHNTSYIACNVEKQTVAWEWGLNTKIMHLSHITPGTYHSCIVNVINIIILCFHRAVISSRSHWHSSSDDVECHQACPGFSTNLSPSQWLPCPLHEFWYLPISSCSFLHQFNKPG